MTPNQHQARRADAGPPGSIPSAARPFIQIRQIRAWSPSLLLMALIFALSARPELGRSEWLSELYASLFGRWPWLVAWLPVVARLDPVIADVGHLAVYGALAAALDWGVRRQRPHFRRPALAAWCLALLYGVSDEWHQHFVPGRHADPWDLVMDGIGSAAVLAALVVWRWSRKGPDAF